MTDELSPEEKVRREFAPYREESIACIKRLDAIEVQIAHIDSRREILMSTIPVYERLKEMRESVLDDNYSASMLMEFRSIALTHLEKGNENQFYDCKCQLYDVAVNAADCANDSSLTTRVISEGFEQLAPFDLEQRYQNEGRVLEFYDSVAVAVSSLSGSYKDAVITSIESFIGASDDGGVIDYLASTHLRV